ncbi:MAG: response regulator [Cytophagaceae bacterium]|nr:response regulator [Gemmatimonadaceae bacterium]
MLNQLKSEARPTPGPPARGAHAILLVDDSEDDAELVRRALSRGGLSCDIVRVDDAPLFRLALEARSWDLVIADYSQPTFGALAVLELLHQMDVDLPCVVISGVAGEDRAVETMRAGAKDFVPKDRLQRLVPVVQRELDEGVLRRERARVWREEREHDRRMHEASASLFELLRSGDFASGNAISVYRTLSELVARALDVDRVSMWMFEADRTVFRCVESFDFLANEHASGQAYEIAENPDYFRALEFSRYVEAHDECGDPRQQEGIARPGEASTQLDAAIRFRGDMVGALCVDHIGAARRWRGDEHVFVGSIADLLALVIEGNERRRAEELLRESEVRYRELWQYALDGMFTLDGQARITSANEAGMMLLQRPAGAILGRRLMDFLVPTEVPDAMQAYAGLLLDPPVPADSLSLTMLRPNGSRVHVEATAQRIDRSDAVVQVLAIVRDVSHRRQLEGQLQQSQKMEAIGRLAGGVAHDFNNLLTAIIGYSQIASIRPDMPAAAVVDLKEITSAAHRAAALTRQLLAFSRRQVLEPRVLNVNAAVSGIELLLRRLIGEDVQLVTDLDPEIAHVLADPSQLEQVILNLAVNARDAMPEGGRLVLRTRMAARIDRGALVGTETTPGPFVVLEVVDGGVGMDEETRSHVFEPFFTTKSAGTGLGLSTVYGIVQQSGGGLALTSEPGVGSTFSVYLPIAAGNIDEHAPTSAPVGATGHESIMLVEDDDRVRALASRILRLAGYTVMEASEPTLAIGDADRANHAIDLVVTDLVLPSMTGRELVKRLQVDRPKLRALFISGYRQEPEAHGTGEAFLPKPFTPEALTTAVRAVLDA